MKGIVSSGASEKMHTKLIYGLLRTQLTLK